MPRLLYTGTTWRPAHCRDAGVSESEEGTPSVDQRRERLTQLVLPPVSPALFRLDQSVAWPVTLCHHSPSLLSAAPFLIIFLAAVKTSVTFLKRENRSCKQRVPQQHTVSVCDGRWRGDDRSVLTREDLQLAKGPTSHLACGQSRACPAHAVVTAVCCCSSAARATNSEPAAFVFVFFFFFKLRPADFRGGATGADDHTFCRSHAGVRVTVHQGRASAGHGGSSLRSSGDVTDIRLSLGSPLRSALRPLLRHRCKCETLNFALVASSVAFFFHCRPVICTFNINPACTSPFSA